jgi:hypothetical protein
VVGAMNTEWTDLHPHHHYQFHHQHCVVVGDDLAVVARNQDHDAPKVGG